MPLEKVCIFAKTRSGKKQCSSKDSGQYKRLTDSQRRVYGTPTESYACAYHVHNVHVQREFLLLPNNKGA